MTDNDVENIAALGSMVDLMQKRITAMLRQVEIDKDIVSILETHFLGRVDPEQLKLAEGKKAELAQAVERVWSKHIEARIAFFLDRSGRKPSTLPNLTPDITRDIKKAIHRHGEDRATAAGIGIFYDPWMIGENEDKKLFLEPWRVWRARGGKDNVERFAAVYYQELEGE